MRLVGDRPITARMIDNEPSCGGAPKKPEDIRCPRGWIADAIDPIQAPKTTLIWDRLEDRKNKALPPGPETIAVLARINAVYARKREIQKARLRSDRRHSTARGITSFFED